MLRFCFAVSLVIATANAQELVDPSRGQRMFDKLSLSAKSAPLRAHVDQIRTSLNLSFRFQTSYFIETATRQYEGPGHKLGVLLRVTPAGGKPVYLGTIYRRLPPIPPSRGNQLLSFGGMFFLGEGEYTVELLLTDEKERVFLTHQKVVAKRSNAERLLIPVIGPGEVLPLSSLRLAKNTSDSQALRLTVLLHAAPNYSRSLVFRPQDLGRLLGAMTSLVEQIPVKSLRVVAFNLDQQKEFYRNDHFEPESFDKLRQALLPVDLGTVDIKILENKHGHIDLLADLLNREAQAEEPADAVVVLGPTARSEDRVKSEAIGGNVPGGPRFFYFEYKPFRNRETAQMPDTIESAMKRLGGKVFRIFNPGDYAKAIAELRKGTAK